MKATTMNEIIKIATSSLLQAGATIEIPFPLIQPKGENLEVFSN